MARLIRDLHSGASAPSFCNEEDNPDPGAPFDLLKMPLILQQSPPNASRRVSIIVIPVFSIFPKWSFLQIQIKPIISN